MSAVSSRSSSGSWRSRRSESSPRSPSSVSKAVWSGSGTPSSSSRVTSSARSIPATRAAKESSPRLLRRYCHSASVAPRPRSACSRSATSPRTAVSTTAWGVSGSASAGPARSRRTRAGSASQACASGARSASPGSRRAAAPGRSPGRRRACSRRPAGRAAGCPADGWWACCPRLRRRPTVPGRRPTSRRSRAATGPWSRRWWCPRPRGGSGAGAVSSVEVPGSSGSTDATTVSSAVVSWPWSSGSTGGASVSPAVVAAASGREDVVPVRAPSSATAAAFLACTSAYGFALRPPCSETGP